MNRKQYIELIDSSFGCMSADDFTLWLEEFLDRGDPRPALPRTNAEPLLDLVNMFNTLPGQALPSFREALDRLLDLAIVPRDQTQLHTIEKLFFLVQMANVAKPERGKRILRRLASIPHLFEIRYAGQRLNAAILNAMCRYDVDRPMITQILNLAMPERGFEYMVMCMRLLSYSMEGRTTYSLLFRIVPMIESDAFARLLGRELDLVIRRLGSSDLLVTYQELKSHEELDLSDAFYRFEYLLRETLLPRFTRDPKFLNADDQAAALLRLQVNSDDVDLGVEEIRAISSSAETIVPRSAVVFLLATLRGRESKGDPGLPCWDMLDYDTLETSRVHEGKVIIYTRGGSFLLRRASESAQIEIFQEAEEIYRSRTLSDADIQRMMVNAENGSFAALIGSGYEEERK